MQNTLPASLFKRLAALVYDGLLITAILFIATFIALYFRGGESFGTYHIGFSLYLITWAGLYVIFCWRCGGQTLGMKAWRLKIVSVDYPRLPISQIIYRYCLGVIGFWSAGISFIWCLIDRDKQSLADRLSGTRMISTSP